MPQFGEVCQIPANGRMEFPTLPFHFSDGNSTLGSRAPSRWELEERDLSFSLQSQSESLCATLWSCNARLKFSAGFKWFGFSGNKHISTIPTGSKVPVQKFLPNFTSSTIPFYFMAAEETVSINCFYVIFFSGEVWEIFSPVSTRPSHAFCQSQDEWFHLSGEGIMFWTVCKNSDMQDLGTKSSSPAVVEVILD